MLSAPNLMLNSLRSWARPYKLFAPDRRYDDDTTNCTTGVIVMMSIPTSLGLATRRTRDYVVYSTYIPTPIPNCAAHASGYAHGLKPLRIEETTWVSASCIFVVS